MEIRSFAYNVITFCHVIVVMKAYPTCRRFATSPTERQWPLCLRVASLTTMAALPATLPTATYTYFSALAQFLRLSVTPSAGPASHRRVLGAFCGTGLASIVAGQSPLALSIGALFGFTLGLAADSAGSSVFDALANALAGLPDKEREMLVKGTVAIVNAVSAFIALRGELANFGRLGGKK